jgi:hypothetical protein
VYQNGAINNQKYELSEIKTGECNVCGRNKNRLKSLVKNLLGDRGGCENNTGI